MKSKKFTLASLVPLFSIIFNFYFLWALESTLSATLLPPTAMPFNSFIRTLFYYLVIVMFLYTPTGQRLVAFFASGRNTIGREERVLEPIIEQLKDRTDIRGYSAPVWFQFVFLNALNTLTGKAIKPLDRRVNRIKYEYLTGTVKIFTYDNLDIDTNSYGNSIFISKGAVDTLTRGELTAAVYNEFAQIKYNIANKRLLHDAGVLIGRASAILMVIVAPFAIALQIWHTIFQAAFNPAGSMGLAGNNLLMSIFVVISGFIIGLIRVIVMVILAKNNINFTQLPYMLYERKIFIDADRATHKAGFSADMASYLDKLYYYKLNQKNLAKLFVELRPLVAYRLNYFENLLGKNSDLSEDNYAWSSNYMERVQVLNNQKQ